MSESDQRPQCIKDDPTSNQSVNIQLSEILHRRHPPLVDTVHILFQPSPDIFQNLIHHRNSEFTMIPLQIICKHRQQGYASILDLPWFSEDLLQCTSHFRISPVKLANEFENFVDSLLGENIVDEVSNEEFHWRALFDLFDGTFGRVALVICVLEKQELTLIKVSHTLFTPHELKLPIMR